MGLIHFVQRITGYANGAAVTIADDIATQFLAFSSAFAVQKETVGGTARVLVSLASDVAQAVASLTTAYVRAKAGSSLELRDESGDVWVRVAESLLSLLDGAGNTAFEVSSSAATARVTDARDFSVIGSAGATILRVFQSSGTPAPVAMPEGAAAPSVQAKAGGNLDLKDQDGDVWIRLASALLSILDGAGNTAADVSASALTLRVTDDREVRVVDSGGTQMLHAYRSGGSPAPVSFPVGISAPGALASGTSFAITTSSGTPRVGFDASSAFIADTAGSPVFRVGAGGAWGIVAAPSATAAITGDWASGTPTTATVADILGQLIVALDVKGIISDNRANV